MTVYWHKKTCVTRSQSRTPVGPHTDRVSICIGRSVGQRNLNRLHTAILRGLNGDLGRLGRPVDQVNAGLRRFDARENGKTVFQCPIDQLSGVLTDGFDMRRSTFRRGGRFLDHAFRLQVIHQSNAAQRLMRDDLHGALANTLQSFDAPAHNHERSAVRAPRAFRRQGRHATDRQYHSPEPKILTHDLTSPKTNPNSDLNPRPSAGLPMLNVRIMPVLRRCLPGAGWGRPLYTVNISTCQVNAIFADSDEKITACFGLTERGSGGRLDVSNLPVSRTHEW